MQVGITFRPLQQAATRINYIDNCSGIKQRIAEGQDDIACGTITFVSLYSLSDDIQLLLTILERVAAGLIVYQRSSHNPLSQVLGAG